MLGAAGGGRSAASRRGAEPARATTWRRSTGSSIGARGGSCGTGPRAARARDRRGHRRPTPLARPARAGARRTGCARAGRSPCVDAAGAAMAAFAMYYRTPRRPDRGRPAADRARGPARRHRHRARACRGGAAGQRAALPPAGDEHPRGGVARRPDRPDHLRQSQHRDVTGLHGRRGVLPRRARPAGSSACTRTTGRWWRGSCEALFGTGRALRRGVPHPARDGRWIWVHDRAVTTYEEQGVDLRLWPALEDHRPQAGRGDPRAAPEPGHHRAGGGARPDRARAARRDRAVAGLAADRARRAAGGPDGQGGPRPGARPAAGGDATRWPRCGGWRGVCGPACWTISAWRRRSRGTPTSSGGRAGSRCGWRRAGLDDGRLAAGGGDRALSHHAGGAVERRPPRRGHHVPCGCAGAAMPSS